MIYFTGLISGIINGIFASGAGQILVFSLVFLLKRETHVVRACSVLCMGIATAVSLYGYAKFVTLKISEIILVSITGLICGWIGAFFMKKINSKVLNFISGIVMLTFAGYNLLKG